MADGQPHEHAAAERDQHVVDEPLAREADEVHAPLVRAERPAHVREGDDEPQHDGQMERDEHLGVRIRFPRIEVDDERRERERRRRQHPAARVELPSAREVPGEERQHEETEVPEEPVRLLVGEVRGEACDLNRDGRSQAEQERLEPAAGGARRLVATAQDELLPEPPAVLARELPGQAVEVAHPLHGDEERLVVCEAGLVQLGDLVPEVILQLVDVVPVDARGVGDVRPPLRDLRLHALHRSGLPGGRQQQTPRPDVVQRTGDSSPLPLLLRECSLVPRP